MLTWLGGSSRGSVASAAASVCSVKPQRVCSHYTWADRALTSCLDLDFHLLTTNNCVSKPVYHKVQTVMGVSRATGVHLLQVQTIWVLSRTKKSLPHHNQQRLCELSFKRSQVVHRKFLSPVSQLNTLLLDAGNSEYQCWWEGNFCQEFRLHD